MISTETFYIYWKLKWYYSEDSVATWLMCNSWQIHVKSISTVYWRKKEYKLRELHMHIIHFVFSLFCLLMTIVSMETTVGAGLGLCVLVIIFFLYMNRKWCFSSSSGNFPCCDESLSSKTIHSFSEYTHYYTSLNNDRRVDKKCCWGTPFVAFIDMCCRRLYIWHTESLSLLGSLIAKEKISITLNTFDW
jgi:hypothetical protein